MEIKKLNCYLGMEVEVSLNIDFHPVTRYGKLSKNDLGEDTLSNTKFKLDTIEGGLLIDPEDIVSIHKLHC